MASWKKVKKIRRTKADKLLKKIKSYGLKFTYELWGGDYCFGIKTEDYNLTITFDNLPDIRFGIWINTSYGNKTNYFFGEHIVYIDKFRPSRVNLHWESLDEMMHTVSYWIKCKDLYKKDMIAAYEIEDWGEFCQDTVDCYFLNAHSHLNKEEFTKSLNKFNSIVDSIDTEKVDIIWRKSSLFKRLYDVYLFLTSDMTDEEVDKLEEELNDCNCSVWIGCILPPHYWKCRSKYQMKVHPSIVDIYTNERLHKRFYRNLK